MARLAILFVFVSVVAVGAFGLYGSRSNTVAVTQTSAFVAPAMASVATPAAHCEVSGDLVGDGNPAAVAAALCGGVR
jgi:hypothetical protein